MLCMSTTKMEESTLFNKLLSHLRSTSRYYTGYPRDIGPSRVIEFKSERQFVQLLHEGYPVVVAFTIRCSLTRHLDRMLEEAAAEFHPYIKFMRDHIYLFCFKARNSISTWESSILAMKEVECPKYPGFCIARQRKDYPFIEIFHSPVQAESQGRIVDSSVTRYSVRVLPFNYDMSPYGFREFFKRHGISSRPPEQVQDGLQ